MTDYDQDANAYHHWEDSENRYWIIEQTRYFDVLGSIRGLNILELACGDGRNSRRLIDQGAHSVIATDVSEEMIKHASEQNHNEQGDPIFPNLTFRVVDACDEKFRLEEPADLVTAMYLFHYASSETALVQMCEHVSRNLKPGGRFVCYTVNPDFDLSKPDPRIAEAFGFRYEAVDPPHYHLIFRGLTVNMWHWSKAQHETALRSAGLCDIQWHPLYVPEDRQDLRDTLKWYLDNPSCTVVSARKPD